MEGEDNRAVSSQNNPHWIANPSAPALSSWREPSASSARTSSICNTAWNNSQKLQALHLSALDADGSRQDDKAWDLS